MHTKTHNIAFRGMEPLDFKPKSAVRVCADFVHLLSILPVLFLKAWRATWRGQDRLDAHKQTKEEHETTGET